MSTIANLDLVLGAQTGEFDKGTDRVSNRLKQVGGEVEQFKKRSEGGGGIFGGLGKNLRAQAMEERRGGIKQLGTLLDGNALAFAGVGGLLVEKLGRDIAKVGEASKQALMGKGSVSQVVDTAIEAIPGIGQGYQIANSSATAFNNIRALYLKSHGATNREVLAAMDSDTANEIQQIQNDAQKVELARTRAIMREVSVIGVYGAQLRAAQNKIRLDQNKEELSNLRDELKDPKGKYAYADQATKDSIFRTRKDALASQATMADQAPLLNELHSIREAAGYVRDDFADVNKQLKKLGDSGASVAQLDKYRYLLMQIHDAGAAKGVRESTMTPLEKLKHDVKELDRLKEEDLLSPEEYARKKGDLANETRKSLGLFGEAQKVGATEQRHGFSFDAGPQLADPISKLLGVTTSTLKENQRQRIALEKLIANHATVLSLDDLPGK